MEIKLNEQQYKDLISGIVHGFRCTRNFYLTSLSVLDGTNNSTKEEVESDYVGYEDCYTDFFQKLMDIADEQIVSQKNIDYLISIYDSIGLKAYKLDKE